MIKNFIQNIYINFIFILLFILVPNFNSASEILLYADNISYDENENVIARGNAKVFEDNQFVISELIIYDKKNKKIILPTDFILKDGQNNYFGGTSGFLENNFEYGEFKNVTIKLNDGSRIIGTDAKRDGHIDIISKGVYSPCKSRIKIGNFLCPLWQLEGEKILHDNKNLFLYQKHAKMRILQTPVYYIPYLVTPSPLRKERKSGFLSNVFSFTFWDTKVSQSISFPYYFNISRDKELTLTPILNYGGGVDPSQRFIFDYNQILSGGKLKTDLTFDTNFEQQNNNKWFSDASLITDYEKNLTPNYSIEVKSALQTKKNYIQITKPNDELSYTNSLRTSVALHGYNLNRLDDYLQVRTNFYQTNQENEDNKTIPTVLPSIEYYSGNSVVKGNDVNFIYEYYNIFRDKHTQIHSKKQQKISQKVNTSRSFTNFNSVFTLQSELYNQLFYTEDKLLDNNNFHSGSYYRIFPIVGLSMNSPFKFKNNKYDLTYEPKVQIVLSPGISNTNMISNEDSSNNSFTLENINSLNRFSGSDKLDNSKRISYGFLSHNDYFTFNLSQSYEFTNNSNYHYGQGNEKKLSDFLGMAKFRKSNEKYDATDEFEYNFRYNSNKKFLKEQNVRITKPFSLGQVNLLYLDSRSKTNNIIKKDIETLNYKYEGEKFLKFSKINLSGLYDLQKEINTEYKIGYAYFDECFGINLDFSRKSYEEDDLKPQDKLTLMFSFKNVGSFKSTNLAVSETDKQDIQWEDVDLDNELFEDYE